MSELVLLAVDTPVGRYRDGLSWVRPDALAALMVLEAVERADLARGDRRPGGSIAGIERGKDNRNVALMAGGVGSTCSPTLLVTAKPDATLPRGDLVLYGLAALRVNVEQVQATLLRHRNVRITREERRYELETGTRSRRAHKP